MAVPDALPSEAESPQSTAPSGGDPSRITVVGIGASSGGLETCAKLLSCLHETSNLALILVQHLDPTHESMMVELLESHTAMIVRQAEEGMPVERNHLYVIPPGTYLSVKSGLLQLSPPEASRGARLPFDFLLRSLAEEYGAQTVCVILSGTGADGSAGLGAVKAKGGFVIAQDPMEAAYDGMPQSAVATGLVDAVLPVEEIPGLLVQRAGAAVQAVRSDEPKEPDGLTAIIALLRQETVYDFTLYRPGTLQRRIERRMVLAGIQPGEMDRYLTMLRSDANELDCLAKDLLINVTGFFRDPAVFKYLEDYAIPDLIRRHSPDQPIRIWVAGCSTGEETYTVAMLFQEQIDAAKLAIPLQVFASDVDPDAIVAAREGVYPVTIETDISRERLSRFFSKGDFGYRVAAKLRELTVFTVQDVLADPPFSRIDLVSCRNLLIYLRPKAQAKVISLFHFSLREKGLLLLGSAETVAKPEGRFELVSKKAKLYRRVGRSRPEDIDFSMSAGEGPRPRLTLEPRKPAARQSSIAELCRQRVLENHAPAAIMINGQHEVLYSMGPAQRYLRIAPGAATHDLLAMARSELRLKLMTGIRRAKAEKQRIVIAGGRATYDGTALFFNIDIEPVSHAGQHLLLICFTDEPRHDKEGRGKRDGASPKPGDAPRVAELERELSATQIELRDAVRTLEQSSAEQKAINQEALSYNEEYQSANEELVTSKEELQSLNEELTALNSQLHETLARQRTSADDLENVLYSTSVATLFLDVDLKIRFFTPATKSLFALIPGDIGRPLADLRSFAPDGDLPGDAQAVLLHHEPIEREIETENGSWFRRRILPYRTHANGVEGVVVTFNDITTRKHVLEALQVAKQQAELANALKSRFLASASHDLRQPLQSLTLLQGLLARSVKGEKEQALLAKLDETLGSMSGMLDTLLDINQIEAGVVRPKLTQFRIGDLLNRMRDEFGYHAQAKGLDLRVANCSLLVESDPGLLEQMVRNLLSNAIKYTKQGKVLLGCRRHAGSVSVEVWDTGVGIPTAELHAVFDEYHQLDNPARERSRGLGLGLSIVQRLGILLDHPVTVRSKPGKGSVFSIDLPRALAPPLRVIPDRPAVAATQPDKAAYRTASILFVEDDPDLRELLTQFLEAEGHTVATASDGPAILDLGARTSPKPELIIADYNLPGGLNGIEVCHRLRETLGWMVPVIILTGDISTDAFGGTAPENCLRLHKPMTLKALNQAVQTLLLAPTRPPSGLDRGFVTGGAALSEPTIFVVDDDRTVSDTICSVLAAAGRKHRSHDTSEGFLEAYQRGEPGCLLIDAYLPGMDGLTLLQTLRKAGDTLPAIMITGNSDVTMAVRAMKAGASDFIEKPVHSSELLASIDRALDQSRGATEQLEWREAAKNHLASLTPRQRQIMTLVLAGQPSKNIAADLGISQRTVENHRASIMKKTETKSLPALARLALAATGTDRADVMGSSRDGG